MSEAAFDFVDLCTSEGERPFAWLRVDIGQVFETLRLIGNANALLVSLSFFAYK